MIEIRALGPGGVPGHPIPRLRAPLSHAIAALLVPGCSGTLREACEEIACAPLGPEILTIVVDRCGGGEQGRSITPEEAVGAVWTALDRARSRFERRDPLYRTSDVIRVDVPRDVGVPVEIWVTRRDVEQPMGVVAPVLRARAGAAESVTVTGPGVPRLASPSEAAPEVHLHVHPGSTRGTEYFVTPASYPAGRSAPAAPAGDAVSLAGVDLPVQGPIPFRGGC